MFFRQKKRPLFKIDYAVLMAGLALILVLYILFSGQQLMLAGVIVCAGLFYTLWGIIHHAREGDLHPKIALEYFLMALLAVVLLLSIIFRI